MLCHKHIIIHNSSSSSQDDGWEKRAHNEWCASLKTPSSFGTLPRLNEQQRSNTTTSNVAIVDDDATAILLLVVAAVVVVMAAVVLVYLHRMMGACDDVARAVQYSPKEGNLLPQLLSSWP